MRWLGKDEVIDSIIAVPFNKLGLGYTRQKENKRFLKILIQNIKDIKNLWVPVKGKPVCGRNDMTIHYCI